jgi:hypothetical protein
MPDTRCVIKKTPVGTISCTAYAMAMLIDAATGGAQTPTGCEVRRRVKPVDIVEGLMLSQVAKVALNHYDVPIAIRTSNPIPTAIAIRRLRNGRGFVLQGNNLGLKKSAVDHAVYVHKAIFDPAHPDRPVAAIVYDSQQHQKDPGGHAGGPQKWPWHLVEGFASNLGATKDGKGKTLGPGVMYAGFGPRRATTMDDQDDPADETKDGVTVRHGAVRYPDNRRRFKAVAAAGHEVNVRRRPRLEAPVVDTLARGELFVGYQRKLNGDRPPGAVSHVWVGDKSGTQWVHRGGLRRV